MFPLLQHECVMRNATALSNAVQQTAAPDVELRTRYLQSLNRLQKYKFPFHATREEIWLEFAYAEPEVRATLDYFLVACDHQSQFRRLDGAEAGSVTSKIHEALALIARFDRDAERAVRTLVGCLLMAGSRSEPLFGGASIGEALGAILLRPDPAWRAEDYAESVLHETIHQALTLDEMVNGLFSVDTEVLASAESRVVSSVRTTYRVKRDPETVRRYDMSFHAAAVAAGLIGFYEALEEHRRAREFYAPLPESLTQLREKSDLLTEHGVFVLDSIERFVGASAAARA